MRVVKKLGLICVLAGAAFLGDSCNVNDKIVNPVRYRNVKVDPKSYQNPFKMQKKYVLNENGMLELHLGHNSTWYKVGKELRVNERSLEQMLKDQGEEIAKAIKEKYEQKQPVIKDYMNKIIETYKEIFGSEENGRTGKDSK